MAGHRVYLQKLCVHNPTGLWTRRQPPCTTENVKQGAKWGTYGHCMAYISEKAGRSVTTHRDLKRVAGVAGAHVEAEGVGVRGTEDFLSPAQACAHTARRCGDTEGNRRERRGSERGREGGGSVGRVPAKDARREGTLDTEDRSAHGHMQ